MEVKKIADILLNMSLGIDYRDDIEDRDDYDEAVMNLKSQQCGMCFISIVNACRMLNRLRRGKQPVHTCGKNRPNLAR